MTTRDKQLVRESFCAIREEASPLSLLFYGRLFELDPKLRPMFHGDIALQGLKLMQMLAVIVDRLDRLDRFDELTETLRAMGQRHTAYGVEARHYNLVEQALVWSLGQALAAPAGSDVLVAWQTLIRDVSVVMIGGADQVSPILPNSQVITSEA